MRGRRPRAEHFVITGGAIGNAMPMALHDRNIIITRGSTSKQRTASAGLRVSFLTFLCILLLFFSTLVTCQAQQDSNFTFTSFAAGSVTLVADSRVINGRIRLVNVSDDAYLLQGVSVGRALYPHSVALRDPATKATASFRTSFTFAIDTNASQFANAQTSGLAWGLFPDDTSIGDIGRYLGLMNDSTDNYLANHVFAIEIDTGYSDFGPYQDVSSCHLGMDLITMHSKPVFDMASPPGSNISLCIEDRGVHTLNVDYNGVSNLLLVNLLDVTGSSIANLNTTVDLYPYLTDAMFVGFASSGLYFRPHVITVLSWEFSSSFGAPAAPPAAPPVATPAKSPGSSPKGPSPAPGPGGPSAYSPGGDSGVAPDASNNCVGNVTACSSPSTSKSNSNVLVYGAAAGGAGALLLLLGLGLGCLCVRRSSKANRGFDQEAIPGGVAVVGPRRFSYKELSKATKNFSKTELLGQGGSGSVYRAILPDSGAMVAVKVIQAERSREMAEKEFQAEVSIINQIRHRNLVQLQGWCNEKGMLCLVYEYLPNGSLDGLLRKEMEAPNTVLPWGTRFNILTGVAAALAYLHEEIGQCILHRDLKPGNVLLDANYNACLADFGLARLIDHDQIAPTTMLAGTMGYIAPEMPHTGRATTQTDVYAFGILIVEMICGRRPTDIDRETQMLLLDCVWTAHAGNDIMCIVDSKIRDDSMNPQIERTLLLGLVCCHPDPACRPSMRSVRQILTGDSPLPPVPAEKPVVYSHAPYELDITFGDGAPTVTNSSKASSNYNTHEYDNNSFSSQSKSFL